MGLSGKKRPYGNKLALSDSAIKVFKECMEGHNLQTYSAYLRKITDGRISIGHNLLNDLRRGKTFTDRSQGTTSLRQKIVELGTLMKIPEADLFQGGGKSLDPLFDSEMSPLAAYRDGLYSKAKSLSLQVCYLPMSLTDQGIERLWESAYVLNRVGSAREFCELLHRKLTPVLNRIIQTPSLVSDRLKLLLTFPLVAFIAERGNSILSYRYGKFVLDHLRIIEKNGTDFEFDTLVRHIATWTTLSLGDNVLSLTDVLSNLPKRKISPHNAISSAQLVASRAVFAYRQAPTSTNARLMDKSVTNIVAELSANIGISSALPSSVAPTTIFRGATTIVEWSSYRAVTKMPRLGGRAVGDLMRNMLERGLLTDDAYVIEKYGDEGKKRWFHIGNAMRISADTVSHLQKTPWSEELASSAMAIVNEVISRIASVRG